MDLRVDQEYRDAIEKALEEYEAQMGIELIKAMKEPECLNMALEQLRKKDSLQLAEYGLELNRYALYIQRTLNKLKAWEKWGYSKLQEAAADNIEKIPTGYGYNERELIAKNKPEVCQKLNKFLREIRLKIDRLQDTPKHVTAIADSMKDFKFAAMRYEKSE